MQKSKKRVTRSRLGNTSSFLMVFLFGLVSVIPLIYAIVTSLKPIDELLLFPPRFWVKEPTFDNYLVLPTLLANLRVPLSRYILNSVLISALGTIGHIIVAMGAAFVISKTDLRGRNVIFAVVQMALLYNTITLAVPRYLIYSWLDIVDTYWVYILPYLPSTLGVFLLKQYMDSSVPDALIEAAKIDGAGWFRIFFQIATPLVKPAWLTLTLFAFRDFWNMTPDGTIFDESLKTIVNATSTIAAGGIARSGSAMAATVIMMIPPIIIYLISQSSVTETMSTSGIK